MLKPYVRAITGIVGALLILTGSVVSYWWFCQMGPLRRVLNPRWHDAHSRLEHWKEIQKGIRRGQWNHDDGWNVGWFGDETWAEWIMTHVEPGANMGSCGEGHTETAMRYITNQDAGESSDAWLTWWQANKTKTQEQWIVDGFRQQGVAVDTPPTFEQTEALLELLGDDSETDETEPTDHLKYNAFRWLRDSGFDPVEFAVSNKDLSEKTEEGLLAYSKRQRNLPAACKVGILPFGEQETDGEIPQMLMPSFQAAVHAIIWLSFVIGVGLVVWSYSKWPITLLPARRWFQFSLGTLFILILVVAAFCGGWVACELSRVLGHSIW